MSISEASRRVIQELSAVLDKKVKIILDNGRTYEGILIGFDHPSLNIMLRDATDNSGNHYSKILVKGERISEIILLEELLFDPEEFKELILREMRLQEHAVRVLPEIRAVEILGRYRVSEGGVVGVGPMAETLYSLYKKYMDMKKKGRRE